MKNQVTGSKSLKQEGIFFFHIHLPDLDVFLGEAGDIQRADDGIFFCLQMVGNKLK